MPDYNFFYLDANDQKQGPLRNVQQIQTLVDQGIITQTTLLESTDGRQGRAGQIQGLKFPPPLFFYFDANGQKQGPPRNAQQLQILVDQGIITQMTLLESTDGRQGRAGQVQGLKFPPHLPEPSQGLSKEHILWIAFGISCFFTLAGVVTWMGLALLGLSAAIVTLILAIKERNRRIDNELEERTLRGDTRALYDLVGRYQQRGKPSKVTQLFKKVAETGSVPAQAAAQYELGCCYMNNEGVGKDINQATQWFQKAAERGHADAQYKLGSCYYNGLGFEKNNTQAIFWLKKASEQGHDDSKKLALQIKQEEQQRQKEEQMQNAAALGDSQAQFDWGDLLCKKNDHKQGVAWFQKAAEQGHTEAQYELGSCYYNGLGFEKNNTQAIFWLKKATGQGHKEAEKLALQIKQEEAQRQKEEQMRNAAVQGDSQAQFDWGDLLCKKNDYEQGVSWFQKAAEQGHAEAQYKLGFSYYNGIGIKKDFDQTIYWAKKASEQGHKEAKKLALQVEELKAVSYDITLW